MSLTNVNASHLLGTFGKRVYPDKVALSRLFWHTQCVVKNRLSVQLANCDESDWVWSAQLTPLNVKFGFPNIVIRVPREDFNFHLAVETEHKITLFIKSSQISAKQAKTLAWTGHVLTKKPVGSRCIVGCPVLRVASLKTLPKPSSG